MAGRQQMRSAFGDGLLRQVEALDASERAAILDLVSEETLTHYRRAMPVGWTSMERHMEVSNAIRAVVGSQRNVEVWHGTMAALTGRPLLSGFLRNIGMRLGMNPGTMYRQTARLWKHLCSEVGELRAEVGTSQTAVELSKFPAEDHHFPCFVEGLHGCLLGLVAPFDVSVQVRVVAVDLDAGFASYDVTW
ncbi:MAG: hypothetical protein KUG77_05655 [Nannocystaceae bacterium]|nr:hypothetical protein [Nannocystaceae bacterium]